jgi:hypothetical protein
MAGQPAGSRALPPGGRPGADGHSPPAAHRGGPVSDADVGVTKADLWRSFEANIWAVARLRKMQGRGAMISKHQSLFFGSQFISKHSEGRLWRNPKEFKTKEAAAQTRDSQFRFTRISWGAWESAGKPRRGNGGMGVQIIIVWRHFDALFLRDMQ